jgi:iron complex transport system substrate-binding protein
MVHFAGAGENLVGVTHECDYPPGVQNLPKLTSSKIGRSMTSAEIDAAIGRHLTDSGSIYALDVDLLAELSPDLILTQGLCDVCAVSMNLVEEAASTLESKPEIVSLNPASLGDVLEDAARIGEALGRGKETGEKIAALRERLARVEEAVAGLPRPRVGCIEWLDPPFSAGHWVPEMVRIAGGEELFSGPGEPSVRLTWPDVFEAAPEVLVLMPCGFGVERTIYEARALPEVPGWDGLPAVEDGRVWAVGANSYFSRPAPRLIEGVEILARILHPRALYEEPETSGAVCFSHAFG